MKRGFLYSSAVFALSVLIFTVAILSSFPIISNAETSGPTMFVNDEPWYNESVYPWYVIDNQCFVPINFFSGLSGVSIFHYPQSNSTLITYNNNYISIDTQNHESAYSENIGVFKMKSMYMGPEDNLKMLYVPATTVCRLFGIGWETSEKKNAIRIFDANSARSFNEIIAQYNPSINNQDVIQDTQNTPESDPTVSKYVYLTFEDAPGSYMNSIVELLNKYGYKATFFLNGNEMISGTEVINKAIASGHSVGLHTMTQNEAAYSEDNSLFLEEIEEQNDLLFRIFKIKTRLIRAPEGSSSKAFKITNELSTQIYSSGYSTYDWNYDSKDLTLSSKTTANNVISAIQKGDNQVIRFHCEEKSYTALKYVLDYIRKDSNIKVMALPIAVGVK